MAVAVEGDVVDVDLDGYEDLLVSNGFESDVMDQDRNDEIRNPRSRFSRAQMKRPLELYPQWHTANAAFRNATTLARLNRCFPLNAPPNGTGLCAFTNATTHVRCRSITCGDGHVLMGDRDRTGNSDLIGDGDTYIFGFKDVTGVPPDQIVDEPSTASITVLNKP